MKDTQNGFRGKWVKHGGVWSVKEWAEENAEYLRGRGYTARVHHTSKGWFAQKFVPDEAVDFRKGRWVKYKDPSNKSLDLDNLIPIEGTWDTQGVIFS